MWRWSSPAVNDSIQENCKHAAGSIPARVIGYSSSFFCTRRFLAFRRRLFQAVTIVSCNGSRNQTRGGGPNLLAVSKESKLGCRLPVRFWLESCGELDGSFFLCTRRSLAIKLRCRFQALSSSEYIQLQGW